jgi:purine-binding chemotaxis protein CheW
MQAQPSQHYYEGKDLVLMTVFTVAGNTFALDARLVEEVTKVGEITAVHDAPTAVTGIRNLRGRIITVIDTASHLGIGSIQIGLHTRMLIIEYQKELFGFLADAVEDTITVNEELLVRQPAGIDPRLSGFITGVWREGNTLTAILDSTALFRWAED